MLDTETPCAKPEPTEEKPTSSSEIRDALQDESLQKLILGIDSSSNPEILWKWRHFAHSLTRFLLLSAPDSKQLFLHEAQYVMQKLTSQAGYGRQKLIILQKYFEAYLCRLPNHTIIRENRNCTCHFGWGHASQVLIFARQVECMLLVEAPKQNGVCIISHKYLLLA
ncbi:hypothetical protein CICLE_v10024381mg [Citrus x clementina]|uniref:Uncharacterized protein n=1 Tax=Citrus clementina TaxID=85681 RepID=V4TTV8_CITCL|nr:hypothetical protein CICLE_v10024381mg [Citrus x clementina]